MKTKDGHRLFAIQLMACVALVLCAALAGCSDGFTALGQAQPPEQDPSEVADQASPKANNQENDANGQAIDASTSDEASPSKASTPLPGSTLFLYMSGADLEEKQGQASVNLNEMVQASIPDDVRVIVQTGGSSKWHKFNIATDKLQRYEVRDGELVLLDELENSSMGAGWTLYQFLEWGKKNYWAERNMLVLWGHGGTSGDNVCYDNLYDSALPRDDLDSALMLALDEDRLDVLAFDACFMGNVENVALTRTYADWMLATTEVTPYTGLDYAQLVSDLGTASTEELCKNACDAFVKKCEKDAKGARAQMSAFDLSCADKAMNALDEYLGQVGAAVMTNTASNADEPDIATGILRSDGSAARLTGAAEAARIYGETDITSLVDIGCFLSETSAICGVNADVAAEALDQLVSYTARGSDCNSSGMALYYPIAYSGPTLKTYISMCPMESYGLLLAQILGQRVGQLALLDSGSDATATGGFAVTVGPDAARTITHATYTLWRQNENDAAECVLIGEGADVSVDWNDGSFASTFDGSWPHLWGQPLLTSVYQTKADGAQYYAPLVINRRNSNVLLTLTGVGIAANDEAQGTTDSRHVPVELWEGLGKDGRASHVYGKLAPGDEVAPYVAIEQTDRYARRGPSATIPADASEEDANQVELAALPDGVYRYQLTLRDIFGRDVSSDYAMYRVAGGQAQLLEAQPAV